MLDQDIFVTLHGHFYQPPRENPWLGSVERQPSAYPYHDWNEKIAAACYTPNTVSRILDDRGRIDHIINNFGYLSFNIGSTLFHWLRRHIPRTADRIVDGDRESVKRNHGHGNAIAQVFNHVIMPLATRREKELQVRWAIHDFRETFGRDPEGMWLAETACNPETLEVLVAHGIRFTILAPGQALRIREMEPPTHSKRAAKKKEWVDVSNATIDTRRPYRTYVTDAKGEQDRDRFIDVFFFDKQLSTDVSFAHLLTSAERLGERIRSGAGSPSGGPRLVNVATDGETFGWHEPFADMCLAYFFENTAQRMGMQVVNYGYYLDLFAPTWEVEIKPGRSGQGTSWSCMHGVDRWQDDCGCTTDSPSWWNQRWRRPLRDAFDALRDRVEAIWTLECTPLVNDVDAIRDHYIEVVLDRSPASVDAFWAKYCKPGLPWRERQKVLRLLESLYNCMLMYTSCAWFFGEISRLEPVQNMKYALRAVEMAQPFTDEDLESVFLGHLRNAVSNIPEMGGGKKIFQTLVKPSIYDMARVANSHAICLLTIGRPGLPVHNYKVEEIDSRQLPDKYESRSGLLRVFDRVTLEDRLFAFHATKFTVRDVRCYLKTVSDVGAYQTLLESLEGKDLSQLPDVFEGNYYSWSDMLPELGGEIMRTLFDHNLKELREQFDHMFDEHKDLFDAYVTAGLELPDEVKGLVSFSLSRAFTDVIIKHRGRWDVSEYQRAVDLMAMATEYGVSLNVKEVEPLITEDLLAEAQALRRDLSPHRLANIAKILDLARVLGLSLRRDVAENLVLEVLDEQVMPKIEALGDIGRDFDDYRTILGILDWAEKLNFSKRRFEETLKRFEEKL